MSPVPMTRPPPLDYASDHGDLPPPLPTGVKVIGWLLLISGVWSAINMLVGLTQNRVGINVGVLTLFIGIGLLRRRPWARTAAIVVFGLAIAFVVLIGVVILNMPQNATFTYPGGQIHGRTAVLPALATFLAIGGLLAWCLHYLTRPHVRTAFEPIAFRRSRRLTPIHRG
jgi:hypothetical protein